MLYSLYIPSANPFLFMERRTFIAMSATAVAALSLPIGCLPENYQTHLGLMPRPLPLAKFCSPDEVKKIGADYIKHVAEEDDMSDIGKHLFKTDDGKIVDAEGPVVEKLLHEKIQKDFQIDNTLVLDGWIVSRTEGRICAALALA
jgi:hypothetical protein